MASKIIGLTNLSLTCEALRDKQTSNYHAKNFQAICSNHLKPANLARNTSSTTFYLKFPAVKIFPADFKITYENTLSIRKQNIPRENILNLTWIQDKIIENDFVENRENWVVENEKYLKYRKRIEANPELEVTDQKTILPPKNEQHLSNLGFEKHPNFKEFTPEVRGQNLQLAIRPGVPYGWSLKNSVGAKMEAGTNSDFPPSDPEHQLDPEGEKLLSPTVLLSALLVTVIALIFFVSQTFHQDESDQA